MVRPRSISDDEIREAARAVFVEDGPSAPVSRIAERLGVTSAALFQRIGTKEDLLRLALGSGTPDGVDVLTAEPPAHGARAVLTAALLDLTRFFQRVVPNLLVLKAAGLSLPRSAPTPLGAPPPVMLRRLLSSWLARAAASGALPPLDASAVAEGLLGAIEARCFNAYLGGRRYAPGDDGELVARLVEGLIPTGTHGAATVPPGANDGAGTARTDRRRGTSPREPAKTTRTTRRRSR